MKTLLIAALSLVSVWPLSLHAQKRQARKSAATKTQAEQSLSVRERAQHMIERFSFGARPGDLEKVISFGPEQWFEQQLQPEAIPDKAAEARLAPLRSIRMSAAELATNFPPNSVLRQVADGKQPMPADPQLAAIYATLIDRLQEQQRKEQTTVPTDAEREARDRQNAQTALDAAAKIFLLEPAKRFEVILALPVTERRNLIEHLRGDLKDRLYDGFDAQQREALNEMQYGSGVAQSELQQAKVLRAVYSERQLFEVMTDFWFNHFNIFQPKDSDQYYTTTYERDVIRKHALGKFSELLIAVAQSPAMLVYLDNASSIGPNSPVAGNGKRGLNENYGRELLELHTLGVNGGYTQQDVTEAARVLTGWTIDHPERSGGFLFDPKRHEPGEKRVLGRSFRNDNNGMQEGLDLLNMLAQHPATARFISTKLAQRFVSDDPPPQLIEAMAATFQSSGGDIREVLRTMVRSQLFWSPAAYRAKIKTPFEFVISSVRASGSEVKNAQQIVSEIDRMGMPLYRMQQPTGYSTAASTWMNSSALLERLSFAIKLTSGKAGVFFDAQHTIAEALLARTPTDPQLSSSGPDDAVLLLRTTMIGDQIGPQTANALHMALQDAQASGRLAADPATVLNGVAGLLLGSPEFQWR
jgi:uncharacterized protein (DUF1800 family)